MAQLDTTNVARMQGDPVTAPIKVTFDQRGEQAIDFDDGIQLELVPESQLGGLTPCNCNCFPNAPWPAALPPGFFSIPANLCAMGPVGSIASIKVTMLGDFVKGVAPAEVLRRLIFPVILGFSHPM